MVELSKDYNAGKLIVSEPKLPFLRLYTGDWLKDPCVSKCSPATRGIWLDLLCAIHEFRRSGQIAGTAIELSRICRCTAAQFVDAANELRVTQTANVSVRNGRYTIVNRRMKRAKSMSKSRKNPSLASGGHRSKSGGQKTCGKNKTTPIPIPNSNSFSGSPKPIGDCVKSLLVDRDLVIVEQRKKFCQRISEIFNPNKREAVTFANIARFLSERVHDGGNPGIFDIVLRWAKEASGARGVRNKKGLFVAKVKKELGFKAQKKLL